jgi:hypothetical protein
MTRCKEQSRELYDALDRVLALKCVTICSNLHSVIFGIAFEELSLCGLSFVWRR